MAWGRYELTKGQVRVDQKWVRVDLGGPPRGFGEQGNKAIYFKGTGEQMPFFQWNRGTSSEIWGTGGHTILCANDIKYCYKEPFLEETLNVMVLVTLVLVWCVSGCFNGPNSGGT